jgi:hypothetical protein
MRVRSLRSILLVFLALAWVPLTSHCKWETLSDFELFHCADNVATDSCAGEPCDEDTCCAVEFVPYAPPRPQDGLPACAVILPADLPTALVQSPPPEVALGVLTAAPPDLPVSWQFAFRTALPARAPSSAS